MRGYKVQGPWYVQEQSQGIVLEVADLFSERDNYTFREGAWRVLFVTPLTGFRTKTFKGESAWSNSRRYYEDALHAIRFDEGNR